MIFDKAENVNIILFMLKKYIAFSKPKQNIYRSNSTTIKDMITSLKKLAISQWKNTCIKLSWIKWMDS